MTSDDVYSAFSDENLGAGALKSIIAGRQKSRVTIEDVLGGDWRYCCLEPPGEAGNRN